MLHEYEHVPGPVVPEHPFSVGVVLVPAAVHGVHAVHVPAAPVTDDVPAMYPLLYVDPGVQFPAAEVAMTVPVDGVHAVTVYCHVDESGDAHGVH